MKPPPFEYLRPASVDEAVTLLAEHGEEAKVLAGGQSLVPLLNLRLTYPEVLVDVGAVDELRQSTGRNGGARLGATVSHAAVEDGTVPDPGRGLLAHVARGIGYRAVRTRGTLGGSLVHADPSAEWPVVLAALDATVRVRSVRGERQVPVRDLYLGYFVTTLEPDELVVTVDVPGLPDDASWGFTKLARKHGEFAESLAVALVRTDPAGTVTGARLWLGAAAEVPLELDAVAQAVVGHRWGPQVRRDVHAGVLSSLGQAADGAGRYQRHLHAVSVCRALDGALGVPSGGAA